MRALVLVLFGVAAVACADSGTSAAPPKKKPKPKPLIRIVEPGPVAFDSAGGLYVGDRRLHRVVRYDLATRKRRVVVRQLRGIVGLAFDDSGRLHVCAGERIYRVEGTRKVVLAGTGRREHAGDGGPATAASLAGATGFEVDRDERIVIAEYDNWIRAIEPDGTIGTLAGTGQTGYAGDGGPARAALLGHPHDIALRRDGVVIADSHNGVLRRVDAAGTITTLATGFTAPVIVEGGPGDTLYVADAQRNAVYRVPDADGPPAYVGPAFVAIGMAVDYSSNVYVAELDARRVVRISPSGRRTVLISR
jgi:hypothetical protein